MTVVLALLFTASKTQAQFFQTEPNHRMEASFRAIDRPTRQSTNPGLFNGNTGRSILRFDEATDLDFGLGVELDYVFKTPDDSQYEIRGFFTDWDTQSSRSGSSLVTPYIPGLSFTQFDFDYQSEMFSLEMNRRHDIFSGLTGLCGVRYMALNEQIDVRFADPGAPLTVTSSTDARNPMLGFQLGGEGRFYFVQGVHLDLDCNVALFSNSARQTTTADSNFTTPTVRRGSNSDATYMIEYALRVHYDLIVDHCSLFVGYEGMYLSGVATAARQIIPTTVLIDDNENLVFNGISFGISLKR